MVQKCDPEDNAEARPEIGGCESECARARRHSIVAFRGPLKENKPVPKTPEEWLAVTTPPEKTKGVLKLFLGYAPGVGKTYSMLSEAIRRHSRGEDVVIGVVETHGRKGIAELGAAARSRPAQENRIQRDAIRGNGRGRDHRAAPAGRAGGRAGAHQYSRQQAPQALRRRPRAAGRENRRALHREYPAHRKHRAHRERDHGHRGARNRAGLGAAALRRNGDGGPDARKRSTTA